MSEFVKPPHPYTPELDAVIAARDAELLRAVADWLDAEAETCGSEDWGDGLAWAADELRKAAEQ